MNNNHRLASNHFWYTMTGLFLFWLLVFGTGMLKPDPDIHFYMLTTMQFKELAGILLSLFFC